MGHVATPNPWMIAPFGALLLLIALGPVLFPAWWHRHYPKVAIGLGMVTLAYYLLGLGEPGQHRALHTGIEYISFIALTGALFVVSGGIHIHIKGEATPRANVMFLLIGAVIANVLGTTGASMLLIRPWIRMNRYRITAYHIVFFILIISNVGGCLTPIGDPPLFLGFLKGVPFWWVLEHCWPMWLLGVGALLAMFWAVDYTNYLKAPPLVREVVAEPPDEWRFDGLNNLFFLAVILGSVFIDQPMFLREGLMIAAAVGSYYTTRKNIHEANHFNFHPVQEVAILFIGIFATMMPALDWLQLHAAETMGQAGAATYYWGTGALSSVLDNAPTYLAFFTVISGGAGPAEIHGLLQNPEYSRNLVAISVGAVFFGANTYIGNGPNFMVKAIADQQKVHTPTFLGYVFKYALPFMLPVLLLVWWVFFR